MHTRVVVVVVLVVVLVLVHGGGGGASYVLVNPPTNPTKPDETRRTQGAARIPTHARGLFGLAAQ